MRQPTDTWLLNREIAAVRGQAYRISFNPDNRDAGYIPIRVSMGGRNLYTALPVERVHDYVAEIHAAELKLAIPGHSDFSIRPAGIGCRFEKFKAGLLGPAVALPAFDGALTVHPLGNRRALKKLATTYATLRPLGLGPLRSYPEAHAAIVCGPPPRDAAPWRPTRDQAAARIAVVVHLHYPELWPDFESRLSAMAQPFALFVTLTADDADLRRRVRAVFPGGTVRVVPNRGFDIGPFIDLLKGGELDGFDLVCKLHGKKSIRYERSTLLGTLWRRHLIAELAGSAGHVDKIVAMFINDPAIGLAGPAMFRVPNERFPRAQAWAANQGKTIELAARLGIAEADFKLDFFAGTMFWARPRALKKIAALIDSPDQWTTERNQPVDGLVEHALERLFSAAVLASGHKIANAPGFLD